MQISKGTVPHRTIRAREGEPGFDGSRRSLLRCLLYAEADSFDDGFGFLTCGRCGANCVAALTFEVLVIDDWVPKDLIRLAPSTGRTTHIDPGPPKDGQPRSSVVKIRFHCEVGHVTELETRSAKGMTRARVTSWDDVGQSMRWASE